MGVFENLPYINFHELNLEWIVKKIKELEDAIGTAQEAAETATEAAEEAQAAAETLTPVKIQVIDGTYGQIVSTNTKVYKIGNVCCGTIGVKIINGDPDPGDILADNLPKPINVAEEGCKILGVQTNSTGGTAGQVIYASVVNSNTVEGGKLAFSQSETGTLSIGAQIIFTFAYTI